jgi:hypothetical protein
LRLVSLSHFLYMLFSPISDFLFLFLLFLFRRFLGADVSADKIQVSGARKKMRIEVVWGRGIRRRERRRGPCTRVLCFRRIGLRFWKGLRGFGLRTGLRNDGVGG